MLPNFRVIVATFLCGFVLVFAGLRIVVTSRAAPATQWPALFDSARALPQAAAQMPAADADTTFRTRFAVEDASAAVPSELKLHAVSLAVRGAPMAMTETDTPVAVPEIAAAVPHIAPAPEMPAAPQPAPAVARVPATDGLSSARQIEAAPVTPANPAPVIAVEIAPATPEPVAAAPVARIEIAALPAPDVSPDAPAAADQIAATVQQENDAPRPVPTAGAGRDMPEAAADSAADTKADLKIAPSASKVEPEAVVSPLAPATESKAAPKTAAKADAKTDSKADAKVEAKTDINAAPKPESKAVAKVKPQPDRAKLAAARKAAAQAAARKARQRTLRHAAAPAVASQPPTNPFAAMFGTFPAADTSTTVR